MAAPTRLDADAMMLVLEHLTPRELCRLRSVGRFMCTSVDAVAERMSTRWRAQGFVWPSLIVPGSGLGLLLLEYLRTCSAQLRTSDPSRQALAIFRGRVYLQSKSHSLCCPSAECLVPISSWRPSLLHVLPPEITAGLAETTRRLVPTAPVALLRAWRIGTHGSIEPSTHAFRAYAGALDAAQAGRGAYATDGTVGRNEIRCAVVQRGAGQPSLYVLTESQAQGALAAAFPNASTRGRLLEQLPYGADECEDGGALWVAMSLAAEDEDNDATPPGQGTEADVRRVRDALLALVRGSAARAERRYERSTNFRKCFDSWSFGGEAGL